MPRYLHGQLRRGRSKPTRCWGSLNSHYLQGRHARLLHQTWTRLVSIPVLDRLSVAEAAEVLSITQDAVRKRVKREQIPFERDDNDRLYVYQDPDKMSRETAQDESRDTSQDKLIAELRAQNEYLRRDAED